MSVNEQIETQYTNIVDFLAQILNGFQKDFVVLTTDGEKTIDESDKLATLDINLYSLEHITRRYNLKQSIKYLLNKNILNLCLTLVSQNIKNNTNVKAAWDLFKRCLRLYRLACGTSTDNIILLAASNFPELVTSIIDAFELTSDSGLINDIFLFTAVSLDMFIKKAGRPIPSLSPNFTRKMLNAYFQCYDPISPPGILLVDDSALQLYLKKQRSPQAQIVFNEFMIERLKILESPDHSV